MTRSARTILKGRGAELEITPEGCTVVIGERCNALGYKVVREAVKAGNFDLVVERAVAQEKAGAAVVNVNMAGAGVPEEEALGEAVRRIAAAVEVPLSIDFASLSALEAALKVAPGRPLVNSVNAEPGKLEPVLEIARARGAALIALPCGEEGIPKDAEGRLAVARRILMAAEGKGMSVDDLVFDPISIGVATDPAAGLVTFETARIFRREFGANLTLGASNVSIHLPKRRELDAAYLALAVGAGVNVPITDPTLPGLKWAVLGADASLGRDEYCMRYIRAFRAEA